MRSKRHKQCRLPHRLRRQSQLNSYRRHRCNALCTKFTSFTLELRINHFWRSLEILIFACSSAGRMVLFYQGCIRQHLMRQHLGINLAGFSSYPTKFPPNLMHSLHSHFLSPLLASRNPHTAVPPHMFRMLSGMLYKGIFCRHCSLPDVVFRISRTCCWLLSTEA